MVVGVRHPSTAPCKVLSYALRASPWMVTSIVCTCDEKAIAMKVQPSVPLFLYAAIEALHAQWPLLPFTAIAWGFVVVCVDRC